MKAEDGKGWVFDLSNIGKINPLHTEARAGAAAAASLMMPKMTPKMTVATTQYRQR